MVQLVNFAVQDCPQPYSCLFSPKQARGGPENLGVLGDLFPMEWSRIREKGELAATTFPSPLPFFALITALSHGFSLQMIHKTVAWPQRFREVQLLSGQIHSKRPASSFTLSHPQHLLGGSSRHWLVLLDCQAFNSCLGLCSLVHAKWSHSSAPY